MLLETGVLDLGRREALLSAGHKRICSWTHSQSVLAASRECCHPIAFHNSQCHSLSRIVTHCLHCFHPPEHFFVPLFGFHFSFLTIFFLSRQSIPIPDQIQPLLLFQVSVIHSDFYFLSVFASVVFALLLSYSCSLLLLRCFALDFLQFFLCTSALSQFLAVTLSRPPVSILSALRLAFKLSEL